MFTRSEGHASQKGIVLIVAMIALLVAAIILPALLFVIGNEGKWSLKQKKVNIAFHMAEAGLDKGVWKLQESDAMWVKVSTGAIIPGYNFDTIYASTDSSTVKEGEFKIKLTTGTDDGSVLVQSIGRDKSTDEVRSLEAVYTKIAIDAGMLGRGAMKYKPNMQVHWGPVVNYENITEAPTLKYPRKISKGYIKNTDEDPSPPNGHDYFSTWPDPATYDYNSYQTDLGDPPTIDLAKYKTIAKNSSPPPYLDATNMVQNPAGSGYWEYDGSGNAVVNIAKTVGSGNAAKSYYWNCSTCVLYFDGLGDKTIINLKGGPTSQLVLQAFILDGRLSDSDLDVDGDNTVPVITGVKIPSKAKTEYRHPDALTVWNTQGWEEGYTVNIGTTRIRGYTYVKGNLKNSGGSDPVFIGIVDCVGEIQVNNTVVYYDVSIATAVLALNVKPKLQWWREINLDW